MINSRFVLVRCSKSRIDLVRGMMQEVEEVRIPDLARDEQILLLQSPDC
jgi:hypothetical protein